MCKAHLSLQPLNQNSSLLSHCFVKSTHPPSHRLTPTYLARFPEIEITVHVLLARLVYPAWYPTGVGNSSTSNRVLLQVPRIAAHWRTQTCWQEYHKDLYDVQSLWQHSHDLCMKLLYGAPVWLCLCTDSTQDALSPS